jgi:hypothetical protein
MDAPHEPAVVTCRWLVERVRRAAPARWLQGRMTPALPCTVDDEAVRLVAERRFWRVPLGAQRALVAWAHGARPGELRRDVPTAREVLSFQARGARCVSLVSDEETRAPLDFAIHDLCHLEKLVDPEHYEAQVGFFHLLERTLCRRDWIELDAALVLAETPPAAEPWAAGRDHVLADMNGSAVFLFVALRTKLLAAARRAGGREDAALEILHDGLELTAAARDAANAVRSRASDAAAQARLHHHFRARGLGIVERCAQDALLRPSRPGGSIAQTSEAWTWTRATRG